MRFKIERIATGGKNCKAQLRLLPYIQEVHRFEINRQVGKTWTGC